MMSDPTPKQPEFEVFVAADGAFAAFEAAVLGAQQSILAGFRIFDMRTKLISDAARAVGDTWFDLLVDALRRGVRLDLTVSDFDPIFATALHRQSWQTVQQGAGLAEAAGVPQSQVRVRALLHPATPGVVPWLAFLPVGLRKLRAKRAALPDAEHAALPGLSGDLPRLHPVTHHHKLAVIDTDTLYIGGLDLNQRRFDTADHDRPAADTWSDVQIILRHDPAVAEAHAHLESFESATYGRAPPPALQHLKRTLSRDRRLKLPFLSPRTVLSEIDALHRTAFGQARHLIYIETQFMRARPMAEAMARAARARPDLALILILPALPETAAFEDGDLSLDTRYGLELERAALNILRDGFGARATIASPVQPVMAARDSPETLAGSPIIYVHNKVLVQDDAFAFVGSANLNGRSLRWDTEAGVALTAPARVATLRAALLRHWWREDMPEAWCDPARMQPLWQAEIARNSVRRPEARRGFLVAHDATLHAEAGQPLPLVTDDIV